MALYLVQHGKSLSGESGEDPGLSPEGIAETARIAEVARGYAVPVSHIRHSVKARARETAQIFASALQPAGGLAETAGLKPLDDAASFSRTLTPEAGVMLVGHLPFMGKLLSLLVTGSADTPVFSFQNSGIVCLDREAGSSTWIIRWTLMPGIGRE